MKSLLLTPPVSCSVGKSRKSVNLTRLQQGLTEPDEARAYGIHGWRAFARACPQGLGKPIVRADDSISGLNTERDR